MMQHIKLDAISTLAKSRTDKYGEWWELVGNPCVVEGYEREGALQYIKPVGNNRTGGHWIRVNNEPAYDIVDTWSKSKKKK